MVALIVIDDEKKLIVKIDETIKRLFEALLFNRTCEASNNHVLVSFKSHSRSVEKETYDNFEDDKPPFASQLVKLELSQVCRDDPKVWCTKVKHFSIIKSTQILIRFR